MKKELKSNSPLDAEAWYPHRMAYRPDGIVVDADLSRKLERERDEARAMAHDMRNQLEKASPARLLFPWENAIGEARAESATPPNQKGN